MREQKDKGTWFSLTTLSSCMIFKNNKYHPCYISLVVYILHITTTPIPKHQRKSMDGNVVGHLAFVQVSPRNPHKVQPPPC